MKILKNEPALLCHSKIYRMIKNIKLYFDHDARHLGIFLLVVIMTNAFFCFLLSLKINMVGIVFRIYLTSLGFLLFLRKINSKILAQSQVLKDI